MSEGPDAPLGAADRLAGFDGLRAIAVLAVGAYHFFLSVAVFPNGTTWNIGQQFRVGVWVFFVLSGFLLYRPHAYAHLGIRRAPYLPSYAWSRFLRIWPAYAVALIVLTFLWGYTPYHGVKSFFVHLTLTQNYKQTEFFRGIGPAWSLAVEVAFYVFLPVFAAVVARLATRVGAARAEALGLGVIAVVGYAWQFATVGHDQWAAGLPSFLPTFAIGMGLAVLVAHGRGGFLARLARHGAWCWLGALGIVVVKGATFGADTFGEGFRFPNQLGYSAVAFLLVLPAVYGRADAFPNTTLRGRPLHALGLISYGVFLWSTAVIDQVQFHWIPDTGFHARSGLVAVVAFTVTVAIATVSWFCVERPALGLKRLVRRPAAATSTG